MEFHPAWHALLGLGVEHGLHALPWREPRGDARLDAFVRDLRAEIGKAGEMESRARRLVERLAIALQASLLVRYAPQTVADAFCASRLGVDGGRAFGTLPAGTEFGEIVERGLSV